MERMREMIRRFEAADAGQVSRLIITTLRTTNRADYTAAYLEDLIAGLGPEDIRDRAGKTHFYVVCEGDEIIGCGAVGPCTGRERVSSLSSVFVLPKYQNRGVGKELIRVLEQDPYFTDADRVEVPASITAVEFYRKLGYDYIDGERSLDEKQLYRLEKITGKKNAPEKIHT